MYYFFVGFSPDFAFINFSFGFLCYFIRSFYFGSLSFYFYFNLCSLDFDFILFLDFDLFFVSFFDKYCLLKESVFWELDLLSCDFFVFSLLELTILPSQLIRARLSEKLIFFIILDILLLTCLLAYKLFSFTFSRGYASNPYS